MESYVCHINSRRSYGRSEKRWKTLLSDSSSMFKKVRPMRLPVVSALPRRAIATPMIESGVAGTAVGRLVGDVNPPWAFVGEVGVCRPGRGSWPI